MMMLRLLPLVAVCLGLLAVTACQRDNETDQATQIGFHGPNRPPVVTTRPVTTTTTTTMPDQGDIAAANSRPPQQVTTTVPQQVTQQPQAHDYPYATPVRGKPGFVINPYQPDQQLDVTGFAPGQEAKDPETNKIFLVP